jgi:hypothetical protein
MSEGTGKVLVACPTYAGKQYALDEWVEGYKALAYEPKCAYQVDNTNESQAYFEEIKKKGIDCTYLQPWPDWDRTFKRCWELILSRAQAFDCYWILSMEADNVVAPEGLEIMVNMALYGAVHLVTHAYPMHESAAKASGMKATDWYYHELGCMLMSRQLLEKAMADYDLYNNVPQAIEATNQKWCGGRIVLTNRFVVKHLDGYQMAYGNLGPSAKKGLICPTPKMPDDFATKRPPCLEEAVET